MFASALPSQAESCREKFTRLFTDRADKGPVKIHVTQQTVGGPTMKNYNYQAGDGHWMSEMIEPANMQWTLVYNNVMFSSSDKGKTWNKIRALDSQQRKEDVQKGLEKTAATAANFACGSEDLDGVKHETVEADYTNPKYKTEHHEKFWLNPNTGWISKSTLKTKQGAFESFVTQLIEPAPNLDLPKPE